MKHFILLSTKIESHKAYYMRNNIYNLIGDFSFYDFHFMTRSSNKRRRYRGDYAFNKKPHSESIYNEGSVVREWKYKSEWYRSYEEYLLAITES